MTNSSDDSGGPKGGPTRPAPPPANGGQKAPTSYGRFIPREELSSFAAWKPGSISGVDPHSMPVHKPEPPPPPKPSPEQLLAEQMRAVRSSAYQDGYRDGLAALDGFKQSYAAQVTAQMGQVTQAYMQQLDDLQEQMARALAVSATQLARQMVRSEITQRPELVASVAQEAVEALLLSARHITLRVHPDDQALVAQGAAEVLAARGARLLPDAAVSRGGCVVESDIGVVDAGMESRWRRAAALLGCDATWPDETAAVEEGEGEAP